MSVSAKVGTGFAARKSGIHQMIINHPLLGPRDAQEFVYLGDAALIDRPDWQAENAADAFHDYLYLRDNPAGTHQRALVSRAGRPLVAGGHAQHADHEITDVALARDVPGQRGRSR